MDRRITLGALVVVVLVAGAGLRYYFSPAQVIRRSIMSAATAFGEERLLATMKPIFKGYRDPYGLDFEFLLAHIKSLMDSCEGLDLEIDVAAVEVKGDSASMDISFTLTGTCEGQSGAILGTPAEPCAATLKWEKKAPGFRIVTTSDVDLPPYRDQLRRRAGNEPQESE